MDRKIHFGIIGCGMIANWYASAIRAVEEAEVVGVFDNNQKGSLKFALPASRP